MRFITDQGVTVQSFERRCGLANGSVAKMGDNTRRSTLARIKSVYPNLNINWLLTGVGDVLESIEGESGIDEMFDAGIQDKRKGRIIIAYQYLRGHGIVHTQQDVAERMGATESSLSRALNGDTKYLTDKFVQRFNNAFGCVFNLDWLLTGAGEMLASTVGEEDFDDMFDADMQITDKRKERIANAFQYLRGHGIVHTQRDVSRQMGASPSNVSSAFNGVESALTDRFMLRFNHAFGDVFNMDWLLTGVGEMLAPTDGESDIQIDNNVIASAHYTGDSSINTAAVMQKENELLKEKVDLLERMLNEKDEIIGLLKDVVGLRKKDKNER